MKRILSLFLVCSALVAVTAPAHAVDVWWGTSSHTGRTPLLFWYKESSDPNYPPWWYDDISWSFTAYKNATVKTAKFDTASGNTVNSPQAKVAIYTNDTGDPNYAHGIPGTLLGETSMATVPDGATWSSDFASTVSLTAGTVYHFRIITDIVAVVDPNDAKKFRINAGNALHQTVYTGEADADMQWMRWDHGWDYPPPLPDILPGWVTTGDGNSDPPFGLYDASSNPALGEGTSGGVQNWNHGDNNKIREKLVLDVPDDQLVGNAIQTGKVRVYYKGNSGITAGSLYVQVLDSSESVIASGSAVLETTTGWHDVTLDSPVVMDEGSTYYVQAYYTRDAGSGTIRYGRQTLSGALHEEFSFHGTDAILQTWDNSGSVWEDATDKDLMFGMYIPEPASALLLLVGLSGVIRRRART